MKWSLVFSCIMVALAMAVEANILTHSSFSSGVKIALWSLVVLIACASIWLASMYGQAKALPEVTPKDVVLIRAQWGASGSRKAVVEFLDRRVSIVDCPDGFGVGDHVQVGNNGELVKFPVQCDDQARS